MMHICTVVGARPQFVKAAVVCRALKAHPEIRHTLVHTGQHYDDAMSEIFFREMEIPTPDLNLGVGGGSHGQNTGRMLEKLEAAFLDDRPDVVLVYGDTDSTLAAALAAVKLHIPVAHVEAGLRSFNRRMPEEINRVLTDHVSEILFTPTTVATENLAKEGISPDTISQVGDVMYDATLYYTERAERASKILTELGLEPRVYALATVHRAENTDDLARMRGILGGLGQAGMPVILPMHPRTRARISTHGLKIPDSIRVVDPVGYFDMIVLEKNASAILTDSGGVQKEAYFHGVPCLTLRDETEWTELVEHGANTLVGADAFKISHTMQRLRPVTIAESSLYGDGCSGNAIVSSLTARRLL